MTDGRRDHLELVAAGLTQAYFAQHTAASRDYRELLDTYNYILDALLEQEQTGRTTLRSSDSLATPEADESNA
jgi:hypothetical protein